MTRWDCEPPPGSGLPRLVVEATTKGAAAGLVRQQIPHEWRHAAVQYQFTPAAVRRPWRRCSSCWGVCHWHDTDWVCDDCGSEWNADHAPRFGVPS